MTLHFSFFTHLRSERVLSVSTPLKFMNSQKENKIFEDHRPIRLKSIDYLIHLQIPQHFSASLENIRGCFQRHCLYSAELQLSPQRVGRFSLKLSQLTLLSGLTTAFSPCPMDLSGLYPQMLMSRVPVQTGILPKLAAAWGEGLICTEMERSILPDLVVNAQLCPL